MRLKEMTDVKTDEKIMEEMKQAISNYTGSVTRCPPCKARAPAEGAVLKKNASVAIKGSQMADGNSTEIFDGTRNTPTVSQGAGLLTRSSGFGGG
jgi:hypothetical protein